jgi:2-dehydro-3-deoxyphosphogluconate aldolase / (4S)-4-hydroxy-2-oxoglutarate aldolase
MARSETLKQILSLGVVAVIRMKDVARLSKVVEAIRSGGVRCIEITMTVPGAVDIIAEMVRTAFSDVIIGAGTVTDKKIALDVVRAGAKFVVGPVLNLDVLSVCRDNDVVGVPGCFSPTEILTGWRAGADIIKVFPATSLGPKYFKDLAGPFPEIRMLPTGGVTIDNVGEWITAGAVAVGIGSDLLDKKAIEEERYEVLTARALRLTKNYQQAKEKKIEETKVRALKA